MPPFGHYPYSWGGMYRSKKIGKSKRRGRRLQPSYTQHLRGGNIVLRPELKYLDTAYAAVALTAGATAPMGSLVMMAQGLTASTRVGQSITVRSVQLSLSFNTEQFIGVVNSAIIRVVLVLDTQANGAVANETDIFANASDVNSLRTIGEVHRFKILMDRKLVANAPGLAWNGSAEVSSSLHKTLKFYKKMKTKIHYTLNAGNITDVSQNNISLFIYSDVILPLTRVSGTARIRYTDL